LGSRFGIIVLFLAMVAWAYQPLGRTAYLTSSFGEDRGTRYHMGIDFSTDMEEGWPVIAPSDGVVEFAARGPFGYGRYLRFKAQSGHVWLFAHLAEFHPKIDTLIRAEILKREKINVQLSLKMRFKKGDTLAYSGSTGIGNPHLHIEYRTPNGKAALNPCARMQCTDTIAPYILDAAPFDSGFAVKIVDYSREPLENPMSIYSLEILQNKKNIFSKKYDTIPIGQPSKISEDLIKVEDADSVADWHFINAKVKAGSKIMAIAKDFANNVSKKELTLRTDTLKLKAKDTSEVIIAPPSLGTIFLKTDFAGKLQCRIPVLNYSTADFRDKDNKWLIYDYDSDPKELLVERRDFDFAEMLKVKVCNKTEDCIEAEVKCR